MQERSTESDNSSPTVSTEALLLSLVADAHEKRKVVAVDIEGAYLHADMTSDVIIELDPYLSAILLQIDPAYSKFVHGNEKRRFICSWIRRYMVVLNRQSYFTTIYPILW
jgi:hypothetical protein